jgi:phosphoribosyl 1,2-cyclic phosphodiesterase
MPAVRVVCWGTRGSLPSPGPKTARFGGNTSCVEIRAGGGPRLIFDAGTGIVGLGRQLTRAAQPLELELFLTHFHWDHIHGLPLFGPLHNPAARIRIHAERQGSIDIRPLIATLMSRPFFPVALGDCAAQIEFHHLDGRSWFGDHVTVTPLRVQHPEHTCGFRIACGAIVVVYIPDNEPAGAGYPVPATWKSDLLEFVHGADLLIHDATFTPAEYDARHGWGHATYEQAVQLAEAGSVRRLLLFHHAPDRSDDELDAIVERVRDEVAGRGSTLQVDAAVEGQEVVIAPPR